MTRKRLITLSTLGLLTTLLLATFAVAQSAQARAESRQSRLFGSWEAVVTTEVQGTTFPALLTFSSDGGMLADETPSPFETTGHGNWVSAGRREAAFTFVSIIGNADGALEVKLKVVGKLQYDDDSDTWSGPFSIDVIDPDGQVVLTDRGTFSLTRIAVEQLN
jgi:hypothetical protein